MANNKIEDLQLLVKLLHDFDLPISPILEYAIKQKEEELASETSVIIEKFDNIVVEQNIRSKATTLVVTKDDGSQIEGHSAAWVLCNTIIAVGAEKVQTLNINVDGMNLVTVGGNKSYPSAQYDLGNGYFVNTHSNTITKKRQIERIISSFNLNWTIEIIKVQN